LIAENRCSMVCIQESKLQTVDDLMIISTLEQQFLGQYVNLHDEGTRGGIILACSQDTYSLFHIDLMIRSTLEHHHVLVSQAWELLYPNCHQQAGSSTISDHCPMVLFCTPFQRKYKGFRFKSTWLLAPDFTDVVKESWCQPISASNKAWVLHIKLERLAKVLK
jgi:hypothetical protein